MFPLVQKSARAALIQSDGEKKTHHCECKKKKLFKSGQEETNPERNHAYLIKNMTKIPKHI